MVSKSQLSSGIAACRRTILAMLILDTDGQVFTGPTGGAYSFLGGFEEIHFDPFCCEMM
jgi:hypothetical protein